MKRRIRKCDAFAHGWKHGSTFKNREKKAFNDGCYFAR